MEKVTSGVCVWCRFLLLFTYSTEPTKLDLDVLLALCNVEIDAEHYPCVERWKRLVESHSQEEQSRYEPVRHAWTRVHPFLNGNLWLAWMGVGVPLCSWQASWCMVRHFYTSKIMRISLYWGSINRVWTQLGCYYTQLLLVLCCTQISFKTK